MSSPKVQPEVHSRPSTEASPTPQSHSLQRWFPRTIIIIMAIILQAVICILIWVFAGLRIAKQIVMLPDNVATWIYLNQSETTTIVTWTSTILAMTGSFLLGIPIQHALLYRLFRLSGGIHLSTATACIQLARCSPFIQPRRHLWWTVLSLIWIAALHFLTTAWSNLLTPEFFLQGIPVNGRDLDFLSPALSDYFTPLITPTTQNYTLTPESVGSYANFSSAIARAGYAAASVYINLGFPILVSQFNASTGGVNYAPIQDQLSDIPPLAAFESYQEVDVPYTLTQQGFTADVSCRMSSSPTITLNNTASVPVQNPAFNYTLETWSWSTNCSRNVTFSVEDITLLIDNTSPIGNGLFATSVCFFQDFLGPSNQSFLVLMQSPSDSRYSGSYFATNSTLPIVCQFTPLVTTVEVQYNQNGLVNVSNVVNQTILPDYAGLFTSTPGLRIWQAYLYGQGPYSNTFADDVLALYDGSVNITTIMEQYLLGAFEFLGSDLRAGILDSLKGQRPENMAYSITGNLNVLIVGWQFRLRTHGVALVVITLVTVVTAASGIYALLEANSQKAIRASLERGSAAAFDVTGLMDVLLASSMGNLARALSKRETADEREGLTVRLLMMDGSQPALHTPDDAADDAGKEEPASNVSASVSLS